MLKPIDCTALEEHIRSLESPHRAEHSVSVGKTNVLLARKFNVPFPTDQLVCCGLLHDMCREWDEGKLVSYAEEHHLPLEPEETGNPVLLHAPVAADIALSEGYGKAIATAIRWHTLGSVTMGKLGEIVFISDYLEPLRTHINEEERQSLLAHATLDEVCLAVLAMQDAYFVKKGRKNAGTTETLEKYLREGKRL